MTLRLWLQLLSRHRLRALGDGVILSRVSRSIEAFAFTKVQRNPRQFNTHRLLTLHSLQLLLKSRYQH